MAKARVLVVDDEPVVLSIVAKALAAHGYETHAVSSPTRAIEIAKAAPDFDVVVSDVIMPEMCGPELVRRIAEICPGAAIVLMSGHINVDGLPKHAAFLGKPFLMTDLYATMEKALALCRNGREGDGGNGG